MAKTFESLTKALVEAKTTSSKLAALSELFVNTCITAKNGGIADSFVAILTTAESADLGTFGAVASIVDSAERKARELVGAHRATAKNVKDANTVSL